MASSHKNRITTTKLPIPPPYIPSFEFCKQHSVPVTAEDAQHRAKQASNNFTLQNCSRKVSFKVLLFITVCKITRRWTTLREKELITNYKCIAKTKSCKA